MIPKVHGRQIELATLKRDRLPAPLSRLHGWYRRRFCLQDRLGTMSVLVAGTVCDCLHANLRTGLLDRAGFWSGEGDDVRCMDCGQLWVTTLETELRLQQDETTALREHRGRTETP